ncbi:MAG TPA: GNAT family N-acetyltransferase [Candidatus Bathyarchaeia archaeon]|nr:GNAT family N-acetyltransferase [Candidatus Bathyarchaeia archaeon]
MKAQLTTRNFMDADEKPMIDLMKETFGFSAEFWKWKHRLYPNFNPASITIAEIDGRIVGTSSWIPRELKISSNITARSALGGDTAVDPSFRGRGVGSAVMEFFYQEALRNGIVVVSGFATPEVARKFYAPLGSILMNDSTTTYVKLMNCGQLTEKILSAKDRNAAVETDFHEPEMVIHFNLSGAPPFLISLKNSKIHLEEITETTLANPKITVRGDLSIIIPVLQGEKGMWDVVKLILRRKIKTKGVIRHAITLLRMRKQFRTLLRPMAK